MKHKIIATGMIVILLSTTVCGCGKKEVDYGLEDKGNVENDSSSLAQFNESEKWTDEWTIPNESGGERKLYIDAEIIVPDGDNMSVFEAERTAMDEAFRKQFLKSFFEDSEIYYHDEEHYTREELEKIIGSLEAAQSQYEQELKKNEGNEQMLDFLNEQIKNCKEQLQENKELFSSAPDTYTIAENIGSTNEYAGYRGEIFCGVNFNESSVFATPQNEQYYGPQSLCDYDTVSIIEWQNNTENDAENMLSNECKISMADAQSLAENFLKKNGRSNQVCTKKENLMWHGENNDNTSNNNAENYALYGYSFTYATGIDGVAIPELSDYAFLNTQGETLILSGDGDNGDSMTITVTDQGIIKVSLQNPITVHNVVNQVKLLPLDTVKAIIKNEVTKNASAYYFTSNSFKQMKLIYLKQRDSSKEEVFSYVPVWCLSGGIEADLWTGGSPVFVNAIDGNIIYWYKEQK